MIPVFFYLPLPIVPGAVLHHDHSAAIGGLDVHNLRHVYYVKMGVCDEHCRCECQS